MHDINHVAILGKKMIKLGFEDLKNACCLDSEEFIFYNLLQVLVDVKLF